MPTDHADALAGLVHACAAARAATRPRPPGPPPPLRLVLADLDALLALVYTLVTKLALALRPPAPAHAAAVPVAHDLTQHATALAHATSGLRDDLHGATLTRHVASCIEDIIDGLRALAQSFLDNGHDYLLRTGTLHDLISSARHSIPKDNRVAVHHAWKSDRDSLDDNLQEIAHIIEQAESHDDSPDVLDDGWDEIGLGRTQNMDKAELDRAKNVHQILRLTTLLHKRIYLDLLPLPSSAPPSAFDSLLTQSNRLLSASDDLVAALYAPQDLDHVRNEILQLVNITTSLQAQLPVFLPASDQLTDQLHALSLEDGALASTSASPSKKRADKKWFDTCVDQILRLCSRLTADIPSSAS